MSYSTKTISSRSCSFVDEARRHKRLDTFQMTVSAVTTNKPLKQNPICVSLISRAQKVRSTARILYPLHLSSTPRTSSQPIQIDGRCPCMLNKRSEETKNGILFMCSPVLNTLTLNFEYVRMHAVYRVNQAEYAIRIPMAAPQEYVNIYSTRRPLSLHGVNRGSCELAYTRYCHYQYKNDQQVTHTHTDREQHPRHRHTHTTRTTTQTPKRTPPTDT